MLFDYFLGSSIVLFAVRLTLGLSMATPLICTSQSFPAKDVAARHIILLLASLARRPVSDTDTLRNLGPRMFGVYVTTIAKKLSDGSHMA